MKICTSKFFAILLFGIIVSIIIIFPSCSTSSDSTSSLYYQNAPEIIMADSLGKTCKLSDTKGKLVLLEFWNSAYIESRNAQFEINRLFNIYKDEEFKNGDGFTVFSVSLDKDKSVWKSALAHAGLKWTYQVCDFKGWNSPAAIAYGVNTAPKYFLIDGEQRILPYNFLIQDLEELLQKEMK